jgi:hypothetical protein
MRRNTPETFWARVAVAGPDECWLWTGPPTKDGGYGQIRWVSLDPNGPIRTHRVAWLLTHGEIPARMHLHHRCETPLCCNPAHLELLTPGEHTHVHHGEGCSIHGPYDSRQGTKPRCLTCDRELKRRLRADPEFRARENARLRERRRRTSRPLVLQS